MENNKGWVNVSGVNTAVENCTPFADGTFDASPNAFYQFYTVHALQKEKTLSFIYMFLPVKKADTYEA